MTWEKLRVELRIEVDVIGMGKKRVLDAITKAKPDDWQTYNQAARWYLDNDIDPKQATEWAEKAAKMNENFWTLEAKARALHKNGGSKEAAATMRKAIASAGNQVPPELVSAAERTLAQWK